MRAWSKPNLEALKASLNPYALGRLVASDSRNRGRGSSLNPKAAGEGVAFIAEGAGAGLVHAMVQPNDPA